MVSSLKVGEKCLKKLLNIQQKVMVKGICKMSSLIPGSSNTDATNP